MRGDEADIRWFGEEGDLFPRVWHHDPARRILARPPPRRSSSG